MRGKVAKRLRRACRVRGTFNEQLYKMLKREHLHGEQVRPDKMGSRARKRHKPLPVAKTASVKPAHLVRANLQALRDLGNNMPGYMWRDVRQNWLNAPRHFLVWSLNTRKQQGAIIAKFN